jgi:hypothetical protein
LSRFVTRQNQYSPPILLYRLIITISPLPTRCNIILFQPSLLIVNLLQRLLLIMQNPNHTLYTSHTYTQFLMDNKDILSFPTSIHSKLHDYIIQSNPFSNFETTKAIRCTHPLIGYKQLPQHNENRPQH